MSNMVETAGLTKRFGPIRAVDGLTFAAGRGEVLGFLGPNGAGKSTTLRILTGFIRPDGGEARVLGLDAASDSLAVREKIGYMPETAPAYAEMAVEDFLAFTGRVRGIRGAALSRAVDAAVEKCGLEEVRAQTFETLSKGFKRRTCLAQALLHDPPVLFLDEPTDGLDPNQKHGVRRLIREMASEKCIVLSTHILEEVEAVCTRAVIIDRGRLVADATPEELRSRSPRHGAVVVRLAGTGAGAALKALAALPGALRAEVLGEGEDGAVRVYPRPGAALAAEAADLARRNGWTLAGLHVEEGGLDEVFRSLTAGEGKGDA